MGGFKLEGTEDGLPEGLLDGWFEVDGCWELLGSVEGYCEGPVDGSGVACFFRCSASFDRISSAASRRVVGVDD